MVAQAFNPSIQDAEAGGSLEFKASLVHRTNSTTARAAERNPVLKKNSFKNYFIVLGTKPRASGMLSKRQTDVRPPSEPGESSSSATPEKPTYALPFPPPSFPPFLLCHFLGKANNSQWRRHSWEPQHTEAHVTPTQESQGHDGDAPKINKHYHLIWAAKCPGSTAWAEARGACVTASQRVYAQQEDRLLLLRPDWLDS